MNLKAKADKNLRPIKKSELKNNLWEWLSDNNRDLKNSQTSHLANIATSLNELAEFLHSAYIKVHHISISN